MTHGGGNKGIIMRRPDGTPMSRSEVIVQRRGALKWMPVFFSNDLVHGSWWFVIGSACTMLFSMYPLIQKYSGDYDHNDDVLPATDYDVTWALMIISGFFFTLGSLAFVRAFEEPPKRPLFYNYKHLQSDELLGAWFFLFGTAPAIPYMFLFFIFQPSAFFFFGTVAAIVFTYATYLFVAACYPSDKVHKNYVLPMMIRLLGPQLWIVKHLANDWLAGTWFFLWANGLAAFASIVILFISFALGDAAQIFIWFSGTVSAVLFLVGSAYFVSGSYPHAQQFYYAEGRGHIERDPAFADVHTNNEDEADEEFGDTATLLPGKSNNSSSNKTKGKKAVKGTGVDVTNSNNTSTHNTAANPTATSTTNTAAAAATKKTPLEAKDKPSSSDMPMDSHKKANKGNLTPSTSMTKLNTSVEPDRTKKGSKHVSATAKKELLAADLSGQKESKDQDPSASFTIPPPPVLPPVIVPDENQEDDDDDVDVVEENSAVLHRGHGVTAADLVDKQHRRRSAALGAREQYELQNDQFSSSESSPEKLVPPPPPAAPSSGAAADTNLPPSASFAASHIGELPSKSHKNNTNNKSNNKNNNNKNNSDGKPEKPIRAPKGPPPPPPTF